jgi:hypothetical protein
MWLPKRAPGLVCTKQTEITKTLSWFTRDVQYLYISVVCQNLYVDDRWLRDFIRMRFRV